MEAGGGKYKREVTPRRHARSLYELNELYEFTPAHLPDDETAVAYIITRLTGRALEWVTPLVERRDPVCLSVPAFLDRLQTVFQGETGNPDRNFLTPTSSCP
uniref:DUF4939 domain-containing protein n=1 Tax=Denticeps clupeoides TaxID=299321 RepID=A0AAY4B9N7_9TELE